MIEWLMRKEGMENTLPQAPARRHTGTPQVIDRAKAAREKPSHVLRDTALEIAYRWLFRRQAQTYLAGKYGLQRSTVEAIIRDVLRGDHGPFATPAAQEMRKAA